MKIINKIAYIYIKDKKILSTLSIGKDTYYLPGGKKENNETDVETLLREIKEELDVNIKAETIKYYGTFEAQAHGKAEGVIVKMTCYTAEHEGKLKASSEIQEISWLQYSDINKVSPVDKLIFEDLLKKDLIQ